MRYIGRPPISRELILDEFLLLPPCGRHLVRVNERAIAARLGCNRNTISRAINELEREGKVLRFGRRDSRGLVLRMLWLEANPTLRGRPITVNPVTTTA
jgi:Bacterial regulatory proteins, gntR family